MCWEERGKKAEEGDDGRAGRSSQFRDSWPRRGENNDLWLQFCLICPLISLGAEAGMAAAVDGV